MAEYRRRYEANDRPNDDPDPYIPNHANMHYDNDNFPIDHDDNHSSSPELLISDIPQPAPRYDRLHFREDSLLIV